MLDLLLIIIFLSFLIVGLRKPYIAFMGYMWVDLVVPQEISYGILQRQPLSMIMAIGCFLSLIINVRDIRLPKSFTLPVLMILLLVWITFTTHFFALYPYEAWERWDFAYKTILVCLLIPLTITKKSQLEAFILTWIFSVAYFTLSTGIKTLFGGGGYGHQFVLTRSFLSESSTLSALAVSIIPFIFFFSKRSILFKKIIGMKFLWLLIFICSLATVVGSYARTGLIGIAVYALLNILRTKRKILYIILIATSIGIGYKYLPEDWKKRMGTMQSQNVGEERSAMGRVAVWRWTADFVKTHPFGGGFESYLANEGKLKYNNGRDTFVKSKAFHNIFIQILGEHGYIGLGIYFLALLLTYLKLRKIKKYSLYLPEETKEWVYRCADCSLLALIILHVCGMFIGVAYQFCFLYLSIIIVLSLEKVYYYEYNKALKNGYYKEKNDEQS